MTQRYELHDDSNGFWSVMIASLAGLLDGKAISQTGLDYFDADDLTDCSICWTSADEQKASPKAAS